MSFYRLEFTQIRSETLFISLHPEIMDAYICGGLSLLETAILGSLGGGITAEYGTVRISAFLLLFQFLTIKFYRVFLYHRYFSPLRHLPGPKVSLLHLKA